MNPSAIEACSVDLFTDYAQLTVKYSRDLADKIIRIRDLYMTYLKTPAATDAVLVKNVTQRFKVSRQTAYSDLAVVKNLLPQLSAHSREFHRWRVMEMLLATYRIAQAKMDPRTMERVAATYAKVTNASEPEEFNIPIDKIIVQPWVPTDDPSVLGLPPLPDRERKIRELISEFSSKNPEIQDIEFEDADIQP